MKPTLLDLFSGIGGFSLGLEKAGFETKAFCEIDEDCRRVLKNHWPDASIYENVKEVSLPTGFVDVITGGFPCQDLSCAGKQRGIKGERSGLWYEMRRIISEVRPKFAIMENVPGFLSGERGAWFGEFLGSVAEIGYDAEWDCISAAELGLPQERERLWLVAYPDGRRHPVYAFKKILLRKNLAEKEKEPHWDYSSDIDIDDFKRTYPAIPEHLRMGDGLPYELDEVKSRIKMLGNSIVPEIAYRIGTVIKDYL